MINANGRRLKCVQTCAPYPLSHQFDTLIKLASFNIGPCRQFTFAKRVLSLVDRSTAATR